MWVRPAVTVTVDTFGISVMRTIDRSRTVSTALPPSRIFASEASPVAI